MGDMTRREFKIKKIKLDFDTWLSEFRTLFMDAQTVEEENLLIDIIQTGRDIQFDLITILKEYDESSE